MPYQGTLVSVDQMLDELVKAGRGRRDAAIELQRAFEDNAIVLIFNDAPLTPSQRSGIGDCLRAFVTDPRDTALHFGWAVAIMQHARASRAEFERRCDLVQQEAAHIASDAPLSRESAVRACIESGMIPASTATWDAFCERVRDLADGWVDKKEGTLKRGFDEKTIKRDVKRGMN
jgi:hypothetical protein